MTSRHFLHPYLHLAVLMRIFQNDHLSTMPTIPCPELPANRQIPPLMCLAVRTPMCLPMHPRPPIILTIDMCLVPAGG